MGKDVATYGIYAENALVFQGNGALTAIGEEYYGDANISASAAGTKSIGIYSQNGMTITSGTVNASGKFGIATIAAGKELNIQGGNIIAVSSIDGGSAFLGKVKNSISGTGWVNAAGTGDSTRIEISDTTGQDLSSYKMVAFPAHSHGDITFTPWTSSDSLPTEAGNYYLTNDVTLTDQWNTPAGTTNLCLGGKTITGNLSDSANHDGSVVYIESNSTLNLYDDDEGTGKIVSEEYKYSEEGKNLTVLVRVVDTFDGAFNMYGGTLCATEGNQVYSGVYVNGGSFTLYGGTIQGARASGVDVGSRNGVFTMNGGTISGNEARQGGGVFVQEDGTFTMNGGSITGNEAFATETKDKNGVPMYEGGQGGGVYVEAAGAFTMHGGSITNNNAQRCGGGVYNAGTFNISGNCEICGNTNSHTSGETLADNVYLVKDKLVNVVGKLTGASPIGITMQEAKVFTSGNAKDYIANFTNDDTNYTVVVNGDELALKANSIVTRKPTARALTYNSSAQELVNAGSATGGKMQYTIGTESTTAPTSGWDAAIPTATEAGTYYVWYKVVGDENHIDTAPACVSVTISSRPSGGGTTTYKVTPPASVDNGTATVTPQNAAPGKTVTITPKPDEGYKVDAVTVTDKDGKPVTVKDNGDGTDGFTMPASAVDVAVSFAKEEIQPTPPTPADTLQNEKFVDVPKDSWYHDAVYWAVAQGVTQGTSQTAFSPLAPCTRAQMVTFLWRAAGEPKAASAENPFTDVKDGAYYLDAVLWAVEKGITQGTGKTTFSPDAKVTRAQTVTFLYRYEQSQGGGFTGAWAFPLDYSDAADVAQWAYEPFCWMTTHGVVAGSGGKLLPNANCSRAEIVTMLARYFAPA